MDAAHSQVPKRPPKTERARFRLGASAGARAFAANADELIMGAAAGRAARFSEVRGSWKTGGIERSAVSLPVDLTLDRACAQSTGRGRVGLRRPLMR